MSDTQSLSDRKIAEDDETITDLHTAVSKVLKNALKHGGVVKGLHEVAKALESKRVLVCFLAEQCNEAAYKKLVQALCKTHEVPLIEIPEAKNLGLWSGLFVTRRQDEVKVVSASCVAVTDYGEDSEARNFLQSHIQEQAAVVQ